MCQISMRIDDWQLETKEIEEGLVARYFKKNIQHMARRSRHFRSWLHAFKMTHHGSPPAMCPPNCILPTIRAILTFDRRNMTDKTEQESRD
ncbi:hypothetical protein PUN28_006930 [Cardiocondyla obscurior]|uniref:Uncharacterized protein n=1 Tax=Cardiocondyla obscurior TaxID=286306 RepID=A0AAW2G5K6_9HYME